MSHPLPQPQNLAIGLRNLRFAVCSPLLGVPVSASLSLVPPQLFSGSLEHSSYPVPPVPFVALSDNSKERTAGFAFARRYNPSTPLHSYPPLVSLQYHRPPHDPTHPAKKNHLRLHIPEQVFLPIPFVPSLLVPAHAEAPPQTLVPAA